MAISIFNTIWERFPWRVALVIPIRKPGKDHTDSKNDRPIGLSFLKSVSSLNALTNCSGATRGGGHGPRNIFVFRGPYRKGPYRYRQGALTDKELIQTIRGPINAV